MRNAAAFAYASARLQPYLARSDLTEIAADADDLRSLLDEVDTIVENMDRGELERGGFRMFDESAVRAMDADALIRFTVAANGLSYLGADGVRDVANRSSVPPCVTSRRDDRSDCLL